MEQQHQRRLFSGGDMSMACRVMADALAQAGSAGGAVPLGEAVELAVAHATDASLFCEGAHERYTAMWRRFARVMTREHKVPRVCDVDERAVAVFVHARTLNGLPASPATQRLRLSALRALFRILRALHLATADPSIDLVLPARPDTDVRALTTPEVELCRWNALAATTETLRPATWALVESGVWPVEAPLVRVGDLHPREPLLCAPGAGNIRARTVPLAQWADAQLRRRAALLGGDPDAALAAGQGGSVFSQRNATTHVIRSVQQRAGLNTRQGIGTRSVTRWVAASVLADTGRIEQVAHRLGLSSLDQAAALAGWDWGTA